MLREAPDGPLGEDRARFLAAAAELGWQPRVAAGLCSQIAMRLLIQAGPPLTGITDAGIAAFDAAITARERACGRPLKHYRDALYTSRTVIYHMGAPVRPVARKSTFHLRWPWARHFDGAAPGIGRSLTSYLECASGTRVRATVLAMAGGSATSPGSWPPATRPWTRWPGWTGNGTSSPGWPRSQPHATRAPARCCRPPNGAAGS